MLELRSGTVVTITCLDGRPEQRVIEAANGDELMLRTVSSRVIAGEIVVGYGISPVHVAQRVVGRANPGGPVSI